MVVRQRFTTMWKSREWSPNETQSKLRLQSKTRRASPTLERTRNTLRRKRTFKPLKTKGHRLFTRNKSEASFAR